MRVFKFRKSEVQTDVSRTRVSQGLSQSLDSIIPSKQAVMNQSQADAGKVSLSDSNLLHPPGPQLVITYSPSPNSSPSNASPSHKKGIQKSNSYDSLIQHRHRRQASIGTGYQPLREGNIFEHFLVVGLLPKPKEAHLPKSASTPANLSTSDSAIKFEATQSDPLRCDNSEENGNEIKKEETKAHRPVSTSNPNQNSQNSNDAPRIQVLYKYPPDKDPPSEVLPFIYPENPQTKRVSRTGSMTELQETIYGQLSALEKSNNSFVFLLVHDTDVFYGTCVVNKEILEQIPSFARKHHEKAFPFLDKHKAMDIFLTQNITKRVYCFISRFPFFKLHYNVLHSILARERLYLIEEIANMEAKLDLSVSKTQENEVESILKSYYQQAVPQAGQSLNFTLPGEVHQVTFKVPDGNEDELLANWCLPILFKTLKCETVMTILSACLTEKHVVIQCTNFGVLSCVVLSLIPLLRPYTWQAPMIPILPESMYEYLQAPVPYICGVTRLDPSISLTDAIIIEIEKPFEEHIKLNSCTIVPLPNDTKLLTKIRPLQAQLAKCSVERKFPDAYKTSQEDVDIANKIRLEVQQYHTMFFDTFVPHLTLPTEEEEEPDPEMIVHAEIVESEGVCDRDKCLQATPKKYRDFVANMMDTQMFTEFARHYIATKQEEARNTENMMKELDDKIASIERQKHSLMKQLEQLQVSIHDCDLKMLALRETKKELTAKVAKPNENDKKGNGGLLGSIQILSKSYNKK